MKLIPQRELRNHISDVLRRVEQGERLRVTVDGRPVADLVPISDSRRTFVPRAQIETILSSSPLDRNFGRTLDEALGATIDEL